MTKSILLIVLSSLFISVSAISKNSFSSNPDNIDYFQNSILPPPDTPDVGVSKILYPLDTAFLCYYPNPFDLHLKIRIKNYGNTPVDTFLAYHQVFPSTKYYDTIYSQISPGDSLDYEFDTPIILAFGIFEVCAKTDIQNDSDPSNDRTCMSYYSGPISTNDNDINEYVPIIFPNPFTKSSTLSINSLAQSKASLSILSIDGRLIKQQEIAIEIGENQFDINLENQNPGLYFYTLEVAGQIFSGKLILQ